MSEATRAIPGFLDALASRAATPGGGSASALVGAVAASLCGMVGRLNDKKDGTPGTLHDTIAPADALRARLGALVDEDIAAFEGLASSWKLPDSAEHCAVKQVAVLRATRTPLEIMERSLEVMRLATVGLERSKKNCLSDSGVAGLMAHAALESARLNVMINLPGIRDDADRRKLEGAARGFCEKATALRREIDRLIALNYGS